MKKDIDENELIQYIVVNTELNMSAGKISAQVGHVCSECVIKQGDSEDFKKWHDKYAQKKRVLGGKQKVLENLEQAGFISIRDNGLTEIVPNSLTAVSLGIMTRKEAQSYTKKLQCLKDRNAYQDTYIIKIHPSFPHIMGKDKTIKIQSNLSLDTILKNLKEKLETENSMFTYDLHGYTVKDFLDSIELFNL